jgi:hypothetical protein
MPTSLTDLLLRLLFPRPPHRPLHDQDDEAGQTAERLRQTKVGMFAAENGDVLRISCIRNWFGRNAPFFSSPLR